MFVYLLLFAVIISFRLMQTGGVIYKPAGLGITQEEQRKKDRNFLIFAFLCIITLTALRGTSVGPDTVQYLRHFRRVCQNRENKVDKRNFEIGYRAFVWCISRVTKSSRVFFTICAVVTNIPMALLIYEYSRSKLQSVILYISIGSFTFQLTGIRQSIALSLLILAMLFSLKRKPIWFCAMIILAFFFHRSAVLFLPVYVLSNPLINRRSISFMVLSFFGVFAGGAVFDWLSKLLNYEEYVGSMGVLDSGGWTYVVIMLLVIIMYLVAEQFEGKLDENLENNDRFFFIVLIFALALYLMRYQVRVAERVSLYYRTSIMILLPNAINRFKHPVLRLALDVVCGALAIALFFYHLNGSKYIYTPYWV